MHLTLRRIGAVLLIVSYLATSGWFLLLHILGDSGSTPFAYFWTWDMFPNYPAESNRRAIMGRTDTEEWVRLFPNPRNRFRWGVRGDVTRLDLNHTPQFARAAAEQALESHPSQRLTEVKLVEQYWPAKFNLPDGLYGAVYGSENPQRRSWRVVASWSVDDNGGLRRSE